MANTKITTNVIEDGAITSAKLDTNITISGNITGTLATAAQPNITSLGTLTALTVDDITINGSTISDSGDLTIDTEADLTLTALSDIIHQTTSTNSTAGHHIFKSFNTEIMRIDGGNNRVGIGTTSPARTLSINATSPTLQLCNSTTGTSAENGFELAVAGDTAYIMQREDANMIFGTNNSERMRIDSSGKVGIGTSPSEMLHINAGGNGPEIRLQNSSGSHYIRAYNDNWNFLANASNTAMTIKNSGQVNFGAGLGIGGTGSANTLDDYEEGTWSPVFKGYGGTTNAALTAADASYTRIGRLIHISAYIHSIDFSDITNGTYVIMEGLPFATDVDNYSPVVLGYNNTNIAGGYVENNGQVFFNNSSGTEFQQQNNDVTGNRFMIGITLNLNV